MHDAKIDAYIPLGPGPEGVCEYRLNINKFFEIKLVKHPSEKVLYSERLWIK